MIHIIIQAIPPSNNQYMGKGSLARNHQYQEIKRMWLNIMNHAIRLAEDRMPFKHKEKLPYARALVQITYFFPDKRRRDPDNYAGKMLLDPLTHLGIIQDDSFLNVDLKLSAKVDKENPRTEIRVTRLDGDEGPFI